ncbi:MAG: hypothetical protein ABI353_13925 [Isosphaeraceae bacterium]
MRCTRCDQIAVPQSVGRTPDGVLVFGWCQTCMAEGGCRIEEPAARRIWRRIGQLPQRLARAKPKRREIENRRLGLMGVAGLLAAWALTLTFLGVVRLPGPIQNPPKPIDVGSGWFLLGGGAAMALISVSVWIAALDREALRRHALKLVQVGSATLAVAALGWGIIRRVPARDPWLAAIFGAGLGLSWAAVWLERRRAETQRKRNSPVS